MAAGSCGLAPRETKVLLAWILCDNKDDAATQLQISTTTVRTHLQRIREKYATVGRPAPTKAALLARAIQDGLVDVNDRCDPCRARPARRAARRQSGLHAPRSGC